MIAKTFSDPLVKAAAVCDRRSNPFSFINLASLDEKGVSFMHDTASTAYSSKPIYYWAYLHKAYNNSNSRTNAGSN